MIDRAGNAKIAMYDKVKILLNALFELITSDEL